MVWLGVLVWHIGDVVRKLREVHGLTRKELASHARIRQNTLGALERNVSNFEKETLAKIAIALNITVDGLYAEVPGPRVPTLTDPVDAETVARFAQLTRDQKNAVRAVIDTYGLFPDRPRVQTEHDDATQAPHAHATPRSRP